MFSELRFRLLLAFVFPFLFASPSLAQDAADQMRCAPVHDLVTRQLNPDRDPTKQIFGRTLCADIVSMDQMLVYNRFGSFNPYGMIYAMRRDVVPVDTEIKRMDADACDGDLGIAYHGKGLAAGKVRLRDCKRPRPLTLRANVGDILHVRLTNLLREQGPGFSDNFCSSAKSETGGPFGKLYHHLRQWVSEGDSAQAKHDEVSCEVPQPSPSGKPDGNWPQSRGANMAIQGLTAFDIRDGQIVEAHDACKGLDVIGPNEDVNCYYMVEREGPFFMASTGAPSGGQGDGGSLTHGLFGAVNVQRTDTKWYRSQTSRATFDAVWKPQEEGKHPRDASSIADDASFEAMGTDTVSGERMPLLNMLRALDEDTKIFELVHADLNAVVRMPEGDETGLAAFREFSVFFHDELKTFYPRNFEELGHFAGGQLAGVRDGFAVNYGASGMGDMLLANRKGIGPSANCQECLYEEFFLTSWANGDPALLEQFSEDPSNVHHSYLNDAVVFRNYHAGPKETHVFHLHAHQWFAGNDKGRGSYLDSQTVAPQQGFSYDIYGGGLEVYHKGEDGLPGWYESLGSGNRNRTAGDSIFHCHLYPHFAQGMWELWRVHDVLEDGSRKLPDGQWEPTLSLAEMNRDIRAMKRPGSVDQDTGRRIRPAGALTGKNLGTPIPAVVPLPGQAWPLLPTYTPGDAELTEDATVKAEPVEEIAAFPGYPFYIAGDPGHRPPQPPMDIARQLDDLDNVTDEYLDGGLPRHVVTDTAKRDLPFKLPEDVAKQLTHPDTQPTAKTLADALNDSDQKNREALQSQIIATALALGDMSMKFKEAELKLLDYDGEPIERTAMAFHNNGTLSGSGTPLVLERADGSPANFVPEAGSYASLGGSALFSVNAAPPKPGAPFADPCGAPTAYGTLQRVDALTYNFVTASGAFPVFWTPGGEELTGTNAAGDAEVSNWVSHWRTDIFPGGAPQLFYSDGSGANLITRANHVKEKDPFLKGLPGTAFTPDPAVVGYRRYEGSAVQVDMITNRAGWHDPQARINVLTERSDSYKIDPDNPDSNQGRISPKVTADEEPFFFRALSGECIEFRHTNELPKELQLDDFQVKTPTDTVGQHIHLVKFDVTSSDGSGNGFNYEDGTFAPDEIAARICAAKNVDSMAPLITDSRVPGAKLIREAEGLCVEVDGHWEVKKKDIWKLRLSDNRELFQTTTQRWFADPILSDTREANDTGGIGKADRTLRTVFSHDHFGPSSIQQHGFYTALVIEPQSAQICSPSKTDCTPVRADRELINAGPQDVGARKVIVDLMSPETVDELSYREFALSIADFAVLYDPRDSRTIDDLDETLSGGDSVPMKGMVTLYCEAFYAKAQDPAAMAKICDSALEEKSGLWVAAADDVPPAWLANKRPGDDPNHSQGMADDLLAKIEVPLHGTYLPADQFLRDYLTEYRRKAAGHDGTTGRMASPVAPPARPESISVDHHDPYLVNYRGEPFPLRIGTDSSTGTDCALKDLSHWENSLLTGVTERCSVSEQKSGHPGDPANVFLTEYHEDPVTPILRTYDNDPVQIRLIQGAQEVQHTFTIEGVNVTRHIDQAFPMDMIPPDDITPSQTPMATLARRCELHQGANGAVHMARAGRPDEYRRWARKGHTAFPAGSDSRAFWLDMERQLARCFNTEGRIAAQEIGISEHFEFRSGFMHDNNFVGLGERVREQARSRRSLSTVGELRDAVLELREFLVLRLSVMDTPYHFGTQDALWNGAWGLIRVAIDTRRYALYGKVLQEIDAELPSLNARADANPDALVDPDQLERLRPLIDAPLDTIQQRFPELAFGNAVNDLRQAVPGNLDLGQTDELLPLKQYEGEAVRRNLALPQDRSANMLRRYNLAPEIQQLEPQLKFRRFKDGLFEKLRPRGEVPEYKPVASCPSKAPQVYTAIVAVETRTVFKGGPVFDQNTNYSDDIYDQDGLFLALLDPRRILNPQDPMSVTDDMIREPNNWNAVSRQHLINEIKLVYDRPEPMVMNVKAGDCVFVTLLNALGKQDGVISGTADAPGDAEMPGITSLNVERNWDESIDDDGYITAATDSDRRKDVEPSARLALSLPLPVLTRQSSYARPYGRNPIWALDGVDGDLGSDQILSIADHSDRLHKPRRAQIEQFEFYAGLAFADYELVRRQLPFVGTNLSLQDRFIAELNRPGGIALPDGVGLLPGAQGTVSEQVATLQAEREQVGARVREIIDRATLGRTDLQPILSLEPLGGLNSPIREIDRGTLLREPDVRIVPEIIRDLDPTRDIPDLQLRAGDLRLDTDTQIITRDTSETRLPNLGRVRELDLTVTMPTVDGLEPNVVQFHTALEELVVTDRLPIDEAELLADEIATELEGYQNRLQDLRGTLLGTESIRKNLVTNFVPYAFGALPVKSFGDVIGHPTHGLIGAITVVPENAAINGARAQRTSFPLNACIDRLVAPRGVSDPVLRLSDLPLSLADRLSSDITVKKLCRSFVIVPNKSTRPMWVAELSALGPTGEEKHEIRQFTLFWQDGLNQRDRNTGDSHKLSGVEQQVVADCTICDDSYDFGDKGVSYLSEPFNVRLRGRNGAAGDLPVKADLNEQDFGRQFFRLEPGEIPSETEAPFPVLRARAGEEVVVHVVHPGGRARQRAFATIGQDYNDLFPGFGFARAALLAPGKAITASLTKPVEPGCYLWFDGPLHLRAGGVWGLLDVLSAEQMRDPKSSNCRVEDRQ